MQCVILAGGIGSRMWPETRTVPKTLLPVLDTPFAAWQLSWLAHSGIHSVVYSIGYLGDDVRAYVGDGSRWGVSVVYVDEGEQLRGTAGALRVDGGAEVTEHDLAAPLGLGLIELDLAVARRLLGLLRQHGGLRLDLVHQSHACLRGPQLAPPRSLMAPARP